MPRNDAALAVFEDALNGCLEWQLKEVGLNYHDTMLDIQRDDDEQIDCWVFMLDRIDPDPFRKAVAGAVTNALAVCEHQHGLLLETVDVRADPRAGRGWTLVTAVVKEQAVERQDVSPTG